MLRFQPIPPFIFLYSPFKLQLQSLFEKLKTQLENGGKYRGEIQGKIQGKIQGEIQGKIQGENTGGKYRGKIQGKIQGEKTRV